MQIPVSLSNIKHPSDGELRASECESKPAALAGVSGKLNWSQIVAGRPKGVSNVQQKVASADWIAGVRPNESDLTPTPTPMRAHARSDPASAPAPLANQPVTTSTTGVTSGDKATPALNYAAKVKGVPKSADTATATANQTASGTPAGKIAPVPSRKQPATNKTPTVATNVTTNTTTARARTAPTAAAAAISGGKAAVVIAKGGRNNTATKSNPQKSAAPITQKRTDELSLKSEVASSNATSSVVLTDQLQSEPEPTSVSTVRTTLAKRDSL